MKAVVVEIRGRHAAALSDEGCIIKVRNKNYGIGQVIEMNRQIFRKPAKTVAMTAAAAAIVLTFGVTAWAYCTPYSYVSLDVNPSIEYSVNRFGRVLNAEAVDEDGGKILKNLKLNNKTIDEAIANTVEQIDREGYFQPDDPGGIVIATSCEDEQSAEQLAEDLQDTAEQMVDDADAPVEVESVSVGYDRVLEARSLGTTPGKLNLVQKLQAGAQDPDSIDVQDWLTKPVKDIMKAIKTEKQGTKSEDTSSDPGSVSEDTGSSAPSEGTPADGQTDSTVKQEKAPKPIKQAGSPSSSSPSKPNAKAAAKPEIEKEPEAAQNSPSSSESSINASAKESIPSNIGKSESGSSKAAEKVDSPQKGNGHSEKSSPNTSSNKKVK